MSGSSKTQGLASNPPGSFARDHMAWSAGPGTPLAAPARAALLAASTLLLWLSNPGVLVDGPARLALGLGGLLLWSLAACRTGAWRKRLEWLAGGAYGVSVMIWVQYITPPSLVWIFAGWGLYMVFAGWLLRRLLHHIGLPLATALAFTAIESLRTLVPPPLGLSWVRMGHLFAEVPGLRGVAAFVGVDGLTFLAAATGGLLAIVVLRSSLLFKGDVLIRARVLGRRTALQVAWVGVLWAGAGWVGDRSHVVERMQPGPRVALIQPGFPQERKQEIYEEEPSWTDLFSEQLALSLRAVADERAAGRRVDLVAWGETMFARTLIGAGLQGQTLAEWSALEWPTWSIDDAYRALLHERAELAERGLIERFFAGALFDAGRPAMQAIWDGPAVAPDVLADTHFVSGAVLLDRVPGTDEVRRANGLALWDADAERLGEAWKWHLVPGAESSFGWERYAWARAWSGALMPYVPDFQPERRVRLIELPGPDGAVWRFGGSVCFDNGFDDVYLAHARAGADFHLVVSNEAWYQESVEFDQMIAMSRMWAVESGRALARAANSGISGLWLPDGSEAARLVVDGRDRAVQGTLVVEVPVPAGATGTWFVRFGGLLRWLTVLVPFGLLVLCELLGGRREVAAARPPA